MAGFYFLIEVAEPPVAFLFHHLFPKETFTKTLAILPIFSGIALYAFNIQY